MLNLIALKATCFKFHITNGLLHVNFSHSINRRSELNKTLQTLSEVTTVYPLPCLSLLLFEEVYGILRSWRFTFRFSQIYLMVNEPIALFRISELGAMGGH